MHWVYLEYKITKEELLTDLKEVFKKDDFFFLDEPKSDGIPVQLHENGSYLEKHIELAIQEEDEGFLYADTLAEYLSKKYKCDTVRELHTKIALKEFNDEFAIQVYAVLNRQGKKYIISDDGIDEDGFEIEINREIETNYNTV